MAQGNNGLLGLSLTVIAEQSLPVLQKRLAPLALFTTDFSSEVATMGSAVSTRIPDQLVAQDYSRATGYNALAASSSAVTITLNKHKHFTIGFDDSEVGNIGLPLLQSVFIEPAINSILNAVQNDVLTILTSSLYPSTYSASYASFGFSGLVNGQKTLDASGSNSPRGALLGTNLYYDLLDDIKGVYSTGADALRRGEVGMIANVGTALVPSTFFAGTGLAGFIGGKDAVAMAARLPGVPASPFITIANITDPISGFTVQLRQWYSPDEGMWKLSAVAIYGVVMGNPSSGVRILSTD